MATKISALTLTFNDNTTQTADGQYFVVGAAIRSWTAPTRLPGTLYQNATGFPKGVAICLVASGSNTLAFFVNQVQIMNPSYSGSGGTYMINAIIPPGASYRTASGVTISRWREITF